MENKQAKKETDKKATDKKETDKKANSILNDDLYKTVLQDEYIYLSPTNLNFKIDDIILEKLKKKVEGKCLKIGYIMPNTVSIQTRSLGMINNASFDGMTTYKIKYTCEVCNPVIGQVLHCKVGSIDKSQVICYINDIHDISPIEIYLFKQHHVNNTEFASLKENDIVSVKIGGSKWEYKDTQITSIAQLISIV
jgi:DNA-directed RNA polymerase subunit E'/Rpb7